ncbi:MAG: hypothetical protein JRJ20_13705 [Deltaproteobacteria bacterium]|nr:hypothetical protein [Deltaproteobacteria bacterium]
MKDDEKAIKERLGIPPEAKRVLIFGESSHWDPNWLLTSEQYYQQRIECILSSAIKALINDPRRIFSIECIFFLKMFWDRNPDKHDALRDLINQGRMRLTGSGVTTPDTLLPDTEAIIRDYLIGQEWLRLNGMTQEPRLAYLPDNFGHSPTLPDILVSLGFDNVALTRIDGMYFQATDFRPRRLFPRTGSSAELLYRDLKTLDFIWKSPGGSRILCHWNAFGYFQGDMIALRGIIRWMGHNVGLPARSEKSVAKKIDSYVRRLSPLSQTPYMFCPIGCDFVDPIPDLVSLLDRYNRTRYQDTGVYTVNAGLDDYMELVSFYKDRLQELELDLNPYWMGFYSSRPEIKQRCKKLCRDLILGEKLLAAADHGTAMAPDIEQKLHSAWEILAVSNHHDFITGTSPDRVWTLEQRPWMIKAQEQAQSVINEASSLFPPASATTRAEQPSWEMKHGRLRVETPDYMIELDEGRGGCITQWIDQQSGESLLTGLGNDVVNYKDTGGLWRMGHEYWGGAFKGLKKASQMPASIRAKEQNGLLEAVVESELSGMKLVRCLWFRNDSPIVRMSLTGCCSKRRTITCRFVTDIRDSGLTMDMPGGVVRRPFTKIYDPTFWPAMNFVHLTDHGSDRGMAIFLGGPASVSGNSNGAVEWIALRNAPKEKAFGFLPLLAHPASGMVSEEQTLNYAVWFTPKGDWRKNKLYNLTGKVLSDLWFWSGTPNAVALADSLVSVEGEDVLLSAVKKASRGNGLIVRILSFNDCPGEVRLKLNGREIKSAFLCDARERDKEEVPVVSGKAVLSINSTIATVRMLF